MGYVNEGWIVVVTPEELERAPFHVVPFLRGRLQRRRRNRRIVRAVESVLGVAALYYIAINWIL